MGETIAQGRVNPNTGERNWTILNSAEGLPTEMPIAGTPQEVRAIVLQAVESGCDGMTINWPDWVKR